MCMYSTACPLVLALVLAAGWFVGCSSSATIAPDADCGPVRAAAGNHSDGSGNDVGVNHGDEENELAAPEDIRRRLHGLDSAERRKAIKDLTRNCDRAQYGNLLVELLTGQDARLADELLEVVVAERPPAALPPLLSALPVRPQLASKIRPVIFSAYESDRIAVAVVELLRKGKSYAVSDWSLYLPILVQSRSARAAEFLIEELPKAGQDNGTDILRALEQLTGQSMCAEDWPKWWLANRDKSRDQWLEEALAEARRVSASRAAELLSVRLQTMKGTGAKDEQIDDFLRQLLLGKDAELRRAALATMLETEREAAVRLAAEVARMSSEQYSDETRVLAIRLLSVIGDSQAVNRIVACLADRRPAARKAAAFALGRFECPEATAALLEALSQEDQGVLTSVIESLGRRKGRQAVPRICDFLNTSDSAEILRAAVEALGSIGEPGSAGAIIAAREKFASDHRLRSSFAAALGSFTAPGVEDALKPLLADEHPEVRLATVASLGRLKTPHLLPQLTDVLQKDKEPSVRRAAAVAIGLTGEWSAIPALLRSLKDDEPVAPEAWQAALTLAGDDPELLLSIAENLAGASVTEHRVTRLAAGLLRGLLDPARYPGVQPEFANRCRAFLARILVDSGEDVESAQVLEQLHAAGGRSEWSESALLGACSRTRQFTKAVAICDEMLAAAKNGSERFWFLRLEKASLLSESGEFKSARQAAAAVLAETGAPENVREKAGALVASCDLEIERIAAAAQLAKQKVSFALAEMLTPDVQRREAAAGMVLELGRSAVPILLEILEAGQTAHYPAISFLLGRISGLEYPLQPTSAPTEIQQAIRAWRNWWNESQ